MQPVYHNHHLDYLVFGQVVSTLNLGCLFAKPPPRGLVLQIANILKITYRIICDYLCGQASLLKWRQHPFIIVSSKCDTITIFSEYCTKLSNMACMSGVETGDITADHQWKGLHSYTDRGHNSISIDPVSVSGHLAW